MPFKQLARWLAAAIPIWSAALVGVGLESAVIPTGHLASVLAVAISPDGSLALTGSQDTTAKLWETKTGRELRTFRGHTGRVTQVALTSDLTYAISVSDRTAIVWDVLTGIEVSSMHHPGPVLAVAAAPDGQYVLTGCSDRSVRLWRLRDGHMEREYIGLFNVAVVGFTPDGAGVLAGNSGLVSLWDRNTAQLRWRQGSDGLLAFSPDGEHGFSGAGQRIARVSDLATRRQSRPFYGHTGTIRGAAFTPDGTRVATASDDRTVRMWDVATNVPIWVSVGHTGSIRSIAVSEDGRYVITGSDDRTARLWDAEDGTSVRVLTGHADWITSLYMSLDQRSILAETSRNLLSVIDMPTGRVSHTIQGARSYEPNMWGRSNSCLSANGRYIVSTSLDGQIELWDMGTLEVSQTLASDESGSAIFQLAISPDGAYVVAGTSANTANVWHVASGAAIGELTGHTGNVNAVSMSSNGSNVATGSQDGTVLIWEDWSTEQPTALHGPLNHPAAVTDIAFSSDGRFVAAAGWDGTYRTWDVHSGEQAGPDVIHGQRGASVALSSAGTHILTGSDKTAALWRVSDGERLQTFEGHTDSVTGVGFTEDPRYVVTASKDAGIRVFERNTGALTLTYTLLGKGDWVAIDSNGFYDGSVGAFSQLYYATGLHTVTLDALFERYYRPGLIQMLWDGNVTSLASAASDAAILPPPEVEILSPSDGVHIAKKNTDVMVRVKDQGGGIGEVRLYHNGKHVGTGGHGTRTLQVAPPSVMTTTFDVELVDGTNVLRAIALSDDRIESHPDEIVVYASTADKVADLYLVTVGINEYQNARYSLNYARADAEGMADALIAGGSGIFGRINAQSIHNRDATRDRIMAALDNVIEHARPQDVFVFFYSGHGVVADGDASGGFYLVPTDVTQIYGDSNSLAQAGLPGDDLRDKFSKIAARKQVMFLDACYSGEFVDQSVAARGIREEKAIAQLSRSTGTAVIASTQSEQFAFEFAELGHGLFTYAILEGLRGMADGSPNNGVITISELSAYVQNRIPELSTEHRLQTQYPTVFIWGQDFPLATY